MHKMSRKQVFSSWFRQPSPFLPGGSSPLRLNKCGTTVLNGGVSMVVFFFVNKIIFPEGEAKPEAENA